VAGEYAAVCRETAKALALPVLDLWTKFQQVDGWEEKLLSDGLHLTPEGNRVVCALLQQLIDREYPELRCVLCAAILWFNLLRSSCVTAQPCAT
jgi:lysophospholipase L1-like esterase